jgi:hypothetical protein
MAIPSNIDNFKLKYREIPKVLDLMLVLVEVYNLLIVLTTFGLFCFYSLSVVVTHIDGGNHLTDFIKSQLIKISVTIRIADNCTHNSQSTHMKQSKIYFCAIELYLLVYHACFQDSKLCLLAANDKLDSKYFGILER